jgi:hypothetical protein
MLGNEAFDYDRSEVEKNLSAKQYSATAIDGRQPKSTKFNQKATNRRSASAIGTNNAAVRRR